jgi:predicted aspartyl protease
MVQVVGEKPRGRRAWANGKRISFHRDPMNKLLSAAIALALTACANNASIGYRGGLTDIPHPALGQDFRPSPETGPPSVGQCSTLRALFDAHTDDPPLRDSLAMQLRQCPDSAGYNPISNSANTSSHVYSDNDFSARTVQGRGEIQLEKRDSSYYVPVRINDTITLPFLLDTGASDLVMPADVALTLMRAGALKRGDFIGQTPYRMANGAEEVSDVVVLREVRVGDHTIRNVSASITPAQGEPLLGQSFLSKFGTLTVDYKRRVLVLSP